MARNKLCSCGRADKHLSHCALNEVGVGFSDAKKVLDKMEKDCVRRHKRRNPKRIPRVLKRLGRLWKNNPDLRLGQLIGNVLTHIYYIEDKELIGELEKFYKNRR